jgi:hypothetical protein
MEKILSWKRSWSLLATTAVCLTLNLNLRGQVQTSSSTTPGQPTHVTNVERGEVVAVSGNNLVVRMADGSLRNIEDVPESARVRVDGKSLGIHDLKPGMKLQRTITTTTTPQTITTVQTVKGKVWAINPPLSVILTLENGQNQQFKIPKGQKFNVDGQMIDAFGVRKGMMITATKIVEEPATVVTQKKTVTGQAAPAPVVAEAPAPPPADVPVLVAEGGETPAPAPTAAEAAPAAAPATAPEAASSSSTWLVALLILLALAGVIGWSVMRKKRLSR